MNTLIAIANQKSDLSAWALAAAAFRPMSDEYLSAPCKASDIS
jgi:hypothetical protein